MLANKQPGQKQKKPKNTVPKITSSITLRSVAHDSMAKVLARRQSGDKYMFIAHQKRLFWLDISSNFYREPIFTWVFRNTGITCVTANNFTASAGHIDVLIGFSTGDIIWWEIMSNKFSRINKSGSISSKAVRKLEWVPKSDSIFAVAFDDGVLAFLEKDRDDWSSSNPIIQNSTVPNNPLNVVEFPISKKQNPLRVWQPFCHPISSLSFSPDCEHMAVISEDGYLLTINYKWERFVCFEMNNTDFLQNN